MAANILITGSSGHIGSYFLKKIVQHDYHVYILARSAANQQNVIVADVTDEAALNGYSDTLKKMDIIIHLASFVPKIGDDDLQKSIDVNIKGPMNLISHIREGAKFIYISTCEVYGIPQKEIIDEQHPLNPLTFYGAGKAAAEKFLRVYCERKKISLTVLRLANVYGPGETIARAIPNFIKAVLNKKSPVIFGDGSDKRDFLYVSDAVNYIFAAISNGKNTEYNIASGETHTIGEIAKEIVSLCNSNISVLYEKRQKQKIDYVFDVAKARKDLKYIPQTKIKEGLLKEIEWFRKGLR